MWVGLIAGLVIAFALYPTKFLAEIESRRK